MRLSLRSGPSLSLRLLAFAGVLIALAHVIAWLVLGLLFQRHLERQTQSELERHGLALIAATTVGADQKLALATQPFDPRFNRPASGLYWRISVDEQFLASRSLWDAKLEAAPTTPANGWGVSHIAGPYETHALAVSRDVQLSPNSPPVLFEIATDLAPVKQAARVFAVETALFLALLWLVLALAAWAQVRLGLKPLDSVRKDLTQLNNTSNMRLSEEQHVKEVRPLVQAINGLLDARSADIMRARRRSQDLAHALKTPLTALRLQIDEAPASEAEKMLNSLSLIRDTVDAELAQNIAHDIANSSDAFILADRLWQVVSRTPEAHGVRFDNTLKAGFKLPLSDERALELLGALIENASRFAAENIRIAGRTDHTGVHLTIEDDGPGIPEEERHKALRRGQRLDEQRGRHGLGLSIANSIVEQSGGYLELGEATGGGLCVQMSWPVGTAK